MFFQLTCRCVECRIYSDVGGLPLPYALDSRHPTVSAIAESVASRTGPTRRSHRGTTISVSSTCAIAVGVGKGGRRL
jgi:hypothetical protein